MVSAASTQTVVARLDPGFGAWGRKIIVTYGRDHARVELDRDRWVDRHQDAEEISPQFQEATDRCRDAGFWRIWLNGGSSKHFTWGSGGRCVTLFVPLPLVNDAVAALKTAESRGDLSRLNRLTTKMAAPFDDWLAPGERYLRLGVDFTCTPRQFLTVLRGKAKSLDLQLNGRADGNGVWVRPTRTATQKALRQAFPEQYDDTPDPYAGAAPTPSSRPAAPHRRRSPVAKGRVRYIPAVKLDRRCPCGWQGDRDLHDRQHVRWSVGIPIPSRLTFVEPVAVVEATAPKMWRSLAYDCARLAQRDGHYDFPSFTHPDSDAEPGDNNLRAYLLATTSRVIGYLSVADSPQNAPWDFKYETQLSYNDSTTRPQVGLIFMAKEWRRKGLGAALVRAMAADAGTSVADISWQLPFTNAGQALARSLSPDRVWVS